MLLLCCNRRFVLDDFPAEALRRLAKIRQTYLPATARIMMRATIEIRTCSSFGLKILLMKMTGLLDPNSSEFVLRYTSFWRKRFLNGGAA